MTRAATVVSRPRWRRLVEAAIRGVTNVLNWLAEEDAR